MVSFWRWVFPAAFLFAAFLAFAHALAVGDGSGLEFMFVALFALPWWLFGMPLRDLVPGPVFLLLGILMNTGLWHLIGRLADKASKPYRRPEPHAESRR